MPDGKGGVRSPGQTAGEEATLRLVKTRLPAFLRADRPPALGTQGGAGPQTDQAGLLLLPGREDGRGLGEDQLTRTDVSDGDQVPGR